MDPDVGTWGVAAVQEWLTASGLQRHAELFAENEIDGEMLLTLTSDELEEELEITDEGEREALLEKLDVLRSGASGELAPPLTVAMEFKVISLPLSTFHS